MRTAIATVALATIAIIEVSGSARAIAEPAADPPITLIEARVGGGFAGGGGQDAPGWRAAPVYVGVYGSHAVSTTPWTWMRGGVFVETGDRSAVGASLGPRVALGSWVAGASALAIVAPYTMYGAAAHVGPRIPLAGVTLVPALELAVYFAGSDLPDDKIATQGLLVVGVELEIW